MGIYVVGTEFRTANVTPELKRIHGRVVVTKTKVNIEILYSLISDERAGPLEFLTSTAIPSLLSCYQYGSTRYMAEMGDQILMEKSIAENPKKAKDNQILCKILCKYAPLDIPESGEKEPEASDPIDLSIDISERDIPLKTDLNGNAVVNSAWQPFNDPVTIAWAEIEFKIARKEYWNPLQKIYQFRNVLNSEPIWGFPAKSLKMILTGSRAQDGYGWTVTYSIRSFTGAGGEPPAYNTPSNTFPGWQPYVLDQGTKQILSETYVPGWPALHKQVDIVDSQGIVVDHPVNLDGAGKLKTDGGSVYLAFKGYRELDFALLNLPDLSTYI
jgi:hypothetical protein